MDVHTEIMRASESERKWKRGTERESEKKTER